MLFLVLLRTILWSIGFPFIQLYYITLFLGRKQLDIKVPKEYRNFYFDRLDNHILWKYNIWKCANDPLALEESKTAHIIAYIIFSMILYLYTTVYTIFNFLS